MSRIRGDETFTVNQPAVGAPVVATVARQAEGTTTRNTLNRYTPPMRLEVEDAFFNHDSAVMMPDTLLGRGQTKTDPSRTEDANFMALVRKFHPEVFRTYSVAAPDPGALGDDANRVGGLRVLAAVYRFLTFNAQFRLLVAGHTDTSGSADHNFGLSERRARNVLFLLQGDRGNWADSGVRNSKVEDQKRILKHVARTRKIDCDPGGPIDNVQDAALTAAMKRFQEGFNTQFGKSIRTNGVATAETWGAFFDVYMAELAAILKTTVDGISGHRAQLRFVNRSQPFIACGEQLPIEEPTRDGFRSQQNRRVEFLFFHNAALPDMSCHAATAPFCMRSCKRDECGVYGPAVPRFLPIDPVFLDAILPNTGKTGKFVILVSNEDLSVLPDRPDGQFVSRVSNSKVDDRVDPWAFLEFFARLDPGDPLLERPNTADGKSVSA